MAERVKDKNEVLFKVGSAITRFPIKGPIQSDLASIYPGKVVIGDTTKDSSLRSSIVSWSDFRGGIGLEIMEGAADVDRAWWSTCQLRYDKHLILPPLRTSTAATNGVTNVIGELASEIYANIGTAFHKFNNATDSWGSSLHTLPASPTDIITKRINGTAYMVIAHTTGYTHTTDGSSFNDETEDIKYMAFWDDRLWGITNGGQLKWTDDLSPATPVWTNDAILEHEDGFVTDLLVGSDAAQNKILYAVTKVGLYAHDVGNSTFIATEAVYPYHPTGGIGSTLWRGSIYIPVGMGIYKYTPNSTAIWTVVGPDRDHGVPSDYYGRIVKLVPTHNDLLALLDAATGRTSNLGYSAILAYNEIGWEVRWLGAAGRALIVEGLGSYAYSAYRLYFSVNYRIHHLPLPSDVVNPKKVFPASTYAATGEMRTPWFDAGQSNVTKTALEVRVEVDDASATEAVVVYYATDYSASWTKFTDTSTADTTFDATDDRIEGDGTTTFTLPTIAAPTGTNFRAIRFKLELVRGGTTTTSPDVRSVTLTFRKKLEAAFVHTFTVDLTKRYGNKSAKELRADLVTLIKNKNLVEFTFRDDTGDTRNYYVDVVSGTGLESTGHDETGESRVTAVEP